MASVPAAVLASEVRMMESGHSGRQYRITIALPLGYAAPSSEAWPFDNTPAAWPVVYVLDGNWYFGMVADMIRPAAWCGGITDAIVVGIGYPEGGDPIEAFRDSFTRRNADLTPVRDAEEERALEARHGRPAPTGDAGGFLKFISDELIPTIEREYRADPSRRILLGHSYGGLFALYAMCEAPDLFSVLIAGSPTLTFGDRFMLRREEAFAQERRALPARMVLFVGELEEALDDTTLTDTLRLTAVLQSRRYEGFSLVTHVFPGQNHCEVAAPGFQAGLKLALKK